MPPSNTRTATEWPSARVACVGQKSPARWLWAALPARGRAFRWGTYAILAGDELEVPAGHTIEIRTGPVRASRKVTTRLSSQLAIPGLRPVSWIMERVSEADPDRELKALRAFR